MGMIHNDPFSYQKKSFLRQKQLFPMVLANCFHDIIIKT